MEEYKEVLKRLRVRPSRIGKVINLIRERAEEVKVRASAQISPDPKDDAFCLLNTVVSRALDPVRMANAFAQVIGGAGLLTRITP
ncbi:MAG: hypothetical protein WAN10_13875 [Candidatus Acidiferrales bacterium]